MTDDEIIKALECCDFTDIKDCEECPLYNTFDCISVIIDKTLDLVNQQKAEIERLAARFNDYPVKTLIDNNNMMCSKSSEDYDKWFFNVSKDISYQAIKEFADRLKDSADKTRIKSMETEKVVFYMDEFKLDNLVKEMTEVQENGNK